MPEHPPPPPPPGNSGDTLAYIATIVSGNYTDREKLKAIKKAAKNGLK